MRGLSVKRSIFILAVILLPLMMFTQVNSTPSEGSKLTNGEFIIYVLKDGAWQKAGSLGYDRFFAEKELSLGHFV